MLCIGYAGAIFADSYVHSLHTFVPPEAASGHTPLCIKRPRRAISAGGASPRNTECKKMEREISPLWFWVHSAVMLCYILRTRAPVITWNAPCNSQQRALPWQQPHALKLCKHCWVLFWMRLASWHYILKYIMSTGIVHRVELLHLLKRNIGVLGGYRRIFCSINKMWNFRLELQVICPHFWLRTVLTSTGFFTQL